MLRAVFAGTPGRPRAPPAQRRASPRPSRSAGAARAGARGRRLRARRRATRSRASRGAAGGTRARTGAPRRGGAGGAAAPGCAVRGRSRRGVPARRPPRSASRARSPRRAAGRTPASPRSRRRAAPCRRRRRRGSEPSSTPAPLSLRDAREPPGDHLRHGGEVVGIGAGGLDPELAVVGLLRHGVLEDDHRADRVLPHRVRDVVALDPDRERLEVERLAKLLERLDTACAPLLGLRLRTRERVARVLVGELLQPALLAALGDADLDARAAALGEELRDCRQVARVVRDDDLRRDARRVAVVLEAEASRIVVTSWPPTFSRWNEWRSTILPPRSGNICTTARSCSAAKPITSLSRPSAAPPPGARRGAAPRAAGCGTALRPRSAPRSRRPASSARARAGSAARSRRGTR